MSSLPLVSVRFPNSAFSITLRASEPKARSGAPGAPPVFLDGLSQHPHEGREGDRVQGSLQCFPTPSANLPSLRETFLPLTLKKQQQFLLPLTLPWCSSVLLFKKVRLTGERYHLILFTLWYCVLGAHAQRKEKKLCGEESLF